VSRFRAPLPSEARDALNKQMWNHHQENSIQINTELTVKPLKPSTAEEFNNIIIRTEGEKVVRFSDVGLKA
jgi:HAE1 family hydrophobic/amphiphilic exporter-1/multidrug efflux pump